MTDRYVLVGKRPKREPDLMKWAKWFENGEARRVAETVVGDARVSTVFLGLDHNFSHGGPAPILFETMIFGGKHDDYQERYATWDEAEAGHAKAVALASARK